MTTKTKAKAPKQCDKQRTQRPRQINHGQPNKPTVPSDSLGWDGEERPAAPKPKRPRPRRCVRRRGSPPHSTKQARKQKHRDQTTSGLLTKSHRHEGKAAQSIQQSNNKKTKRGTETNAKQTLATEPTWRRHGTHLDIPFCACVHCVGLLTKSHRDQTLATQPT